MNRLSLIYLLASLSFCLLACGPVDEHTGFCGTDFHLDSTDDGEIGTTSHGLYGRRTGMWPAAQNDPPVGRTDLPVCWENPNSTAIGSNWYVRYLWREARRRTVEESWARHARINFYGWGTCNSASTGLRIVICDMGNNDPRCPAMPMSQAGDTYPGINGLVNGIRLNPGHPASVLVHEVGHTLGLYHAEERGNTTQELPTFACDPSKSGWPNSDPVTYGAYDEDSVMAYCSPPAATPWLSPTDVAGIQRSYGRRIDGQLVSVRGNCAAAHAADGNGDPAFVWDCDEYADDQEYHDTNYYSSGDSWNLRLGSTQYCLRSTSSASGAQVQLGYCGYSTADWRFERMYVKGFGGLCLDLENGNTATGTKIQMWECGALNGANQRWTRTRIGQIKYGTTNKCARLDPFSNRLKLATCSGRDMAQRFTFGSQRIRLQSDYNVCLDVYGPSDAEFAQNGTNAQGRPANGNVIQGWWCNSSMNQRWHLSGALRTGPNANLCLHRSSDGNGAGLSIATCNGSETTQTWDYYF